MGLYAFTPAYTTSGLGNSYANWGVPPDYLPDVHGQVIWPLNKGLNSSGWVGTKFIDTTPNITLKFSVDNDFIAYINNVQVLTGNSAGNNWNAGFTTVVTVPVNSLVYLSLNVIDYGGAFGVAGNVKSVLVLL